MGFAAGSALDSRATIDRLAELWAEVLGVEQVSANDDFFALGGDSLKALTLAAAIEDSLGVPVDPIDIFEWSRLGEFATLDIFAADAPPDGSH